MSARLHLLGRTCLVLLLAVLAGAAESTHTGAEEATAVREALQAKAPPWYDAKADGWRRIALREPEAVKPPSDRGGSVGAELIALLLLAGLVAAVVWVLWQLRHLSGPVNEVEIAAPGAAGPRPVADLSMLPLPDAGLPPDEGLRRALANRDWRRAVVWVHAKLLTRLDGAGAIRVEKGATEGQLLAAARTWAAAKPGRRPAASALQRTGAAFAAVYFGHATADQVLVDALIAADADAARVLAAEGA